MAEIRAFRAYRYVLGRVGSLSDVVAPPYDVIDGALQDQLYATSAYNVIRLILNKEQPSDSPTDNRYTRAQRFLRDWQREGVLAQDSARSLYVYEQEFALEGKTHSRRGFFARVRLEPFGLGKIFPHEETMPGPKADRLQLFHATNMNLSPVFALYPDDRGTIQNCLNEAIERSLPLEARDHLGVTSRLWPVTSQRVVSTVTGAMGPLPVFIADGHHRYETALRYREERIAATGDRDPESAFNFVLMLLVGMNDPGLIIQPTHRLVTGIKDMTAESLGGLLDGYFELTTMGSGEAGARAVWDLIESEGSQDLLGFGTIADNRWHVGRNVTQDSVMATLSPDHSREWRTLAVSVLQELILKKRLGQDAGQVPICRYAHLLAEVTKAAQARECQLVVLVPPVTMSEVAQIAEHHEKMPPKSTYFYPKILSGLVFNPLTTS